MQAAAKMTAPAVALSLPTVGAFSTMRTTPARPLFAVLAPDARRIRTPPRGPRGLTR
jgi:hypothetical protein